MAKDPSFYKDCAAILGPNQPAITTPDPTATGRQFASAEKKPTARRRPSAEVRAGRRQPERSAPDQVKDPLDDVKKKLDKDELRKRAIERLREAIENGTRRRRQAAQAPRGQARHQAARPGQAARAPPSPPAPTPTCPTPRSRPPSAPVPQAAERPEHGRHRPAPRLPARAMKQTGAGIASNPVLVGGVTVLVVIVAVFLSYNANQGLPFVPTTSLKVRVPNGANLVPGNEIRSGGSRVGVDRRHDAGARAATARSWPSSTSSSTSASATCRSDSTFRIRPRSALGLKYLELDEGTSDGRLRRTATRCPADQGSAVDGHRRGPEDVRRRDAQGQPGEPARLRRRVRRPRRRPSGARSRSCRGCSSTCSR